MKGSPDITRELSVSKNFGERRRDLSVCAEGEGAESKTEDGE